MASRDVLESHGFTEKSIAAMVRDSLRGGGAGIDQAVKGTESGDTLLHLAVEFSLVPEVMRLLSAGARMDVKNSNGMTAKDLALENGNQALLQILTRREEYHEHISVVRNSRFHALIGARRDRFAPTIFSVSGDKMLGLRFGRVYENYTDWTEYQRSLHLKELMVELSNEESLLNASLKNFAARKQLSLQHLATLHDKLRDREHDYCLRIWRKVELEKLVRSELETVSANILRLKDDKRRANNAIRWQGHAQLRKYNGMVLKLWRGVIVVLTGQELRLEDYRHSHGEGGAPSADGEKKLFAASSDDEESDVNDHRQSRDMTSNSCINTIGPGLLVPLRPTVVIKLNNIDSVTCEKLTNKKCNRGVFRRKMKESFYGADSERMGFDFTQFPLRQVRIKVRASPASSCRDGAISDRNRTCDISRVLADELADCISPCQESWHASKRILHDQSSCKLRAPSSEAKPLEYILRIPDVSLEEEDEESTSSNSISSFFRALQTLIGSEAVDGNNLQMPGRRRSDSGNKAAPHSKEETSRVGPLKSPEITEGSAPSSYLEASESTPYSEFDGHLLSSDDDATETGDKFSADVGVASSGISNSQRFSYNNKRVAYKKKLTTKPHHQAVESSSAASYQFNCSVTNSLMSTSTTSTFVGEYDGGSVAIFSDNSERTTILNASVRCDGVSAIDRSPDRKSAEDSIAYSFPPGTDVAFPFPRSNFKGEIATDKTESRGGIPLPPSESANMDNVSVLIETDSDSAISFNGAEKKSVDKDIQRNLASADIKEKLSSQSQCAVVPKKPEIGSPEWTKKYAKQSLFVNRDPVDAPDNAEASPSQYIGRKSQSFHTPSALSGPSQPASRPLSSPARVRQEHRKLRQHSVTLSAGDAIEKPALSSTGYNKRRASTNSFSSRRSSVMVAQQLTPSAGQNRRGSFQGSLPFLVSPSQGSGKLNHLLSLARQERGRILTSLEEIVKGRESLLEMFRFLIALRRFVDDPPVAPTRLTDSAGSRGASIEEAMRFCEVYQRHIDSVSSGSGQQPSVSQLGMVTSRHSFSYHQTVSVMGNNIRNTFSSYHSTSRTEVTCIDSVLSTRVGSGKFASSSESRRSPRNVSFSSTPGSPKKLSERNCGDDSSDSDGAAVRLRAHTSVDPQEYKKKVLEASTFIRAMLGENSEAPLVTTPKVHDVQVLADTVVDDRSALDSPVGRESFIRPSPWKLPATPAPGEDSDAQSDSDRQSYFSNASGQSGDALNKAVDSRNSFRRDSAALASPEGTAAELIGHGRVIPLGAPPMELLSEYEEVMRHLEEVWTCEMASFLTVQRLAQTLAQREQTWQRLEQLQCEQWSPRIASREQRLDNLSGSSGTASSVTAVVTPMTSTTTTMTTSAVRHLSRSSFNGNGLRDREANLDDRLFDIPI